MNKEAWVLRLKDDSKQDGMTGDYYLADDADDFLTQELKAADLYNDKDSEIQNLKKHEKEIHERFGLDAVCNFGYTNIMKNFEFVRVEVPE